MDEKLQAALAELINKANQGVDGAVSLMSAELPDVIHQLLVWGLAQAVLSVFIEALFLTLLCFSVVKAIRDYSLADNGGRPNWIHDGMKYFPITPTGMIFCLIVPFSICVCAAAMIIDIFEAAKIWIAPKIWLIEYAASLAK